MDFFLKHKTVILRTLGGLMIVLGFAVHFWVTPKEGISESDMAAINVARMEASVSGKGSGSQAAKQSTSDYLEELKNNQEKQMKYLTIMSMILGVGFLLYSFIKKEEPEV